MTGTLREIAGPAGPLETLLELPAGEPRAVAVFGHPHPLHGGTMHTKVVYQSDESARADWCRRIAVQLSWCGP